MMPDYDQAQTPPSHIAAMRYAAGCLRQLPFVRNATLDDWGRYSNFSLIVDVEISRAGSARRLKEPKSLLQVKGKVCAAVTEYLGQELARQNQGRPAGEQHQARVQFRPTRAVFDDHEATYHLDVDFYRYDSQSNTFEQSPAQA